jgi:hypothetical protein
MVFEVSGSVPGGVFCPVCPVRVGGYTAIKVAIFLAKFAFLFFESYS